ncbi:hypothetical protein C7382_10771 [Porphyromonas loveana]|uniref:Uncharacterized protein n=1 Tax=Porphyromonas loveana TaxID=1884669 RepID=A0A2U1FEZ9_9PORP|nr:hypothetical protein C7382_10771 [Porphyromonas loveana]
MKVLTQRSHRQSYPFSLYGTEHLQRILSYNKSPYSSLNSFKNIKAPDSEMNRGLPILYYCSRLLLRCSGFLYRSICCLTFA